MNTAGKTFEERCAEFPAVDIARRENIPLLRESGGDKWMYKACCPLHNEKTPSFKFDREGGYYCFGCHAYGRDGVDLYAKIYHIRQSEALRRLSGEDVKPVSEEQREKWLNKINLQERARIRVDELKHYARSLRELISCSIINPPEGADICECFAWVDEHPDREKWRDRLIKEADEIERQAEEIDTALINHDFAHLQKLYDEHRYYERPAP